jgi:hypothetical protein
MTFKPGQQQAPQQRGDVEVGDHLYVHHKGQPCTGVVCAHGRHGVTVDVDGGRHKVKWDKVLGHKKRAAQRYNVIEEGEDGMLVEDDRGRRRYVATPNESKEDPMVAKAFGRRPVLLFMKAGGAAPGPGLTQKQITDKNGVQTKRWVSTDVKGPPAQHGQHVGFENGAHRGHGQVSAVGKDGVTVKDPDGGEHRVTHDKITHHFQGDGAPDASPHEDAAEASKAAAAGPDGLFHPDDIASLPDKVNQPAKSWEELVEKGTEGLGQFKDMMGKVQQVMGLKSGMKPEDITPEQWDNDDGFLFVAPLKGEKRAREKCEADYGGDWSQLRDIVRGTISVPSMAHVKQAIEHMKTAGLELAQKPKNRFEKPTPEGYRDLMTFVKLPNGMLAELQIHVKSMTLAKEKGHKDYEITRTLQGKYGEAEPSDKWSAEHHTQFYAAVKRQKDVYDAAWQKSNGGGSKQLIKSEQTAIMQLLFRSVSK